MEQRVAGAGASSGAKETVPYWSVAPDALLEALDCTSSGLTSVAAEVRLRRRPAARRVPEWRRVLRLIGSQLNSPITLILIAAAVLALFLRDPADGAIILAIILIGAVLGFWQEYAAAHALESLKSLVAARSRVLRDGGEIEAAADAIVPGDVVVLSAGSTIPGDCRLLESKDLFVNESALTGESFPVEKQPGLAGADSPLSKRTNVLYQGTHVVSGEGRGVVVSTGEETELGKIGGRLRLRPPQTEFEHGVRRFGYLLLEVTLLLVLSIFVVHLALLRPPLEAFLFALALAVGLTPQMLPAVISVNLAFGARRLAERQVIVRRLSSIENFGSMNVLCSDKTGTLTEGVVRVEQAVDCEGVPCSEALGAAQINARFETGFGNPIDDALRAMPFDDVGEAKLDEIPYDFVRKRLSVLVRNGGETRLITKGAVSTVLPVCGEARTASGRIIPLAEARPRIESLHREFGSQGRRTIAVACRTLAGDRVVRADETGMTFLGLLVLHDPPKAGMRETIGELHSLGVSLKVITGDNAAVAGSVAGSVGLDGARLLTGDDLRRLSDDALVSRARAVDVFAEIEPNQKERIILALKKGGDVVGYLGDGINDATALHAADVGISVDQAVDVAKEAADIVLLRHDLDVLVEGVRQGRATFANTLKYVFLATSANFGNMFSMAGASLFLSYFPLLPRQILLTNFLTDLPEMTIARDRVDDALIQAPQRWDIGLIQRFMIVFGILSSVFDYITFGVLLLILGAGMNEFRTGWFVESVVSACAVVLVVRSREPVWKSRPGAALLTTTLLVIAATIALPYTPAAPLLGFEPLPASFLLPLLLIVTAYAAAAEWTKQVFFRKRR